MVHLLWQPLRHRFFDTSDHRVTLAAFQLLQTISVYATDFLAKRVHGNSTTLRPSVP